jgi:hypothetical protein
MVLNDESGVDGEDLTVNVELNAVAGLHITFLGKVGYKLVLEVTNRDEGGRVVWYFVLRVDGALEDATILIDGVLGVRHYGDPSAAVEVGVPDV